MHIDRERLKLSNTQRVLNDRVGRIIEKNQLRLDALESVVKNLSPQRVLNMGYSIVRVGGKAVSSVANLAANQEVEIELSDAEIVANVKQIKIK